MAVAILVPYGIVLGGGCDAGGSAGSAGGGPDAADVGRCALNDEELRARAGATGSGVYGASTNIGCAGSHCWPGTAVCEPVTATVTVTDTNGLVLTQPPQVGFLAVPLAPGAYRVCASLARDPLEFPKPCIAVLISTGELVRLDFTSYYSLAGNGEELSAITRRQAGEACATGAATQCATDLRCFPGPSASAGTCQRPALVNLGDACDGVTRVCPTSDANGGADHCDLPTRTCVGGGALGAWCDGTPAECALGMTCSVGFNEGRTGTCQQPSRSALAQ